MRVDLPTPSEPVTAMTRQGFPSPPTPLPGGERGGRGSPLAARLSNLARARRSPRRKPSKSASRSGMAGGAPLAQEIDDLLHARARREDPGHVHLQEFRNVPLGN